MGLLGVVGWGGLEWAVYNVAGSCANVSKVCFKRFVT